MPVFEFLLSWSCLGKMVHLDIRKDVYWLFLLFTSPYYKNTCQNVGNWTTGLSPLDCVAHPDYFSRHCICNLVDTCNFLHFILYPQWCLIVFRLLLSYFYVYCTDFTFPLILAEIIIFIVSLTLLFFLSGLSTCLIRFLKMWILFNEALEIVNIWLADCLQNGLSKT